MSSSSRWLVLWAFALMANIGCNKSGGNKIDAAKADSLRQDSIKKATEKLLVKNWTLAEYEVKKATFKDPKQWEAYQKATYCNFKADGTGECTDVDDYKKILTFNWKFLDNQTKLVYIYTDKNREIDTFAIELTADKLTEKWIDDDDKKTHVMVLVPKK